MTYILSLDYILELKHLEKCGSSVMTSSHLNGNKQVIGDFLEWCSCSEMYQMQKLKVTQQCLCFFFRFFLLLFVKSVFSCDLRRFLGADSKVYTHFPGKADT